MGPFDGQLGSLIHYLAQRTLGLETHSTVNTNFAERSLSSRY